MNLVETKSSPEPWEWVRVPIVARREDVERAVALYRQALCLLNEAEALGLAGTMGSLAEIALGEVESNVEYYEGCLNQPGGFLVVGFAVEEDDPESPAILERQRRRNVAIGAGAFTPFRHPGLRARRGGLTARSQPLCWTGGAGAERSGPLSASGPPYRHAVPPRAKGSARSLSVSSHLSGLPVPWRR
jgi:hypothetical protein